ncbi:hypothetical protein J3R83DRAFT_9593 [Lanmaoa asiatica]|nr:hypothetical protein J3R83DRAFT_9593 [Lanmaoa asiatica]
MTSPAAGQSQQTDDPESDPGKPEVEELTKTEETAKEELCAHLTVNELGKNPNLSVIERQMKDWTLPVYAFFGPKPAI